MEAKKPKSHPKVAFLNQQKADYFDAAGAAAEAAASAAEAATSAAEAAA
jgi:hypothetical protein